jgi:NAD(P)-dependent dehydrogenase (short-subunit alcohol dehydrogenase family)
MSTETTQGRVAVITGASSGIGAATARAPGRRGTEDPRASPGGRRGDEHVAGSAAADIPVAQEVLREVDPGHPEPPSGSGADRRSRVLAALLIPVALIVLVVCLATDVLG